MNENEKVKLTSGEVAALKYAQDRGAALPSWLTAEGTNYFRPRTLTPEQFAEYARYLELYNTSQQAEKLASIKSWVTFMGVIALIGVIASILSSCMSAI